MTGSLPLFGVLIALTIVSLLRPARSEVKRAFEVAESAPPGTRVGFLADKSGGEGGGNKGFIMVYPPESQVEKHFAVDEFSGEIRTRSSLDYESRSRYVFLAIRTDGSGGIRVSIDVVDENDNAPSFPVASIDLQLSEYAKLNAETPLPSATDLDSGQFGVQQYRILSGNINNAFRLSTRNLNNVLYVDLIVNGELDREFREQYMLDIEALDGGSPPLSARLKVNVTIIDGNDNSPEFTQPRYLAQLFENATVGSSVIRVQANDKDIGPNARIEYRLLPSPSQAHRRFAIDPFSGLITVAQPVMHDQRKNYELLVVARDGGMQPLESTAFVTVTIIDAGELLPKMTVIFMGAGGQATVSEDALPGDIIARVSVGDPDTGEDYHYPVNMSLSGDTKRHFGIEASGTAVYILQLAKPIDREMKDRYSLTFSALDYKSRLSRKNVTLNVLDVNDNMPLFTKPVYEAEVRERSGPGTSVLQVFARDADIGVNAQIDYSLKNAPELPYSDWFKIDSETGLITTAQAVDCEISSRPQLVVIATDRGGPSKSSEARIVISVLDINDNPPIFKQSVFNATLPEDAEIGSCFLQLSAVDPDCGVNARVHYSIPEAAPERHLFNIDPATGTLCLHGSLDYELTRTYQFSVIAHDGGGLSSSALVQVFISDIDDNAPIFYPAVYNVSVREAARPGLPLLIVSATDKDSGEFGKVRYDIVQGSKHATLFRVDPERGELHMNHALPPDVYSVEMQATDGGGLSSQKKAVVTVNVLSQDQPSPSFDQKLYKFTVREDVLPGIAIGKVRAVGPPGRPVSYAIYSGDPNGRFSINSDLGTITVQQYLDADTEPSLLLNIQAALGNPPSFNHTQVQIIVEDINDNSPEFERNQVETSVSEDHSSDVPFFVVQAHDNDRDKQRNGKVTYRLISTEPRNGPFFIRPVSGELMLTTQLDYETVQQYKLHISAQDDGIPPRSSNMTITVKVQDTNDHVPKFERSEYSAEVVENAAILTRLVQVKATDTDSGQNGHIVYSLTPDSNDDRFGVLADSGWIYVRKELDREMKDLYTLKVVAEDSGTPKLSSTSTVTIRVIDVNDNAPNCSQIVLQAVENQPAGSYVGRVEAHDPDAGQNGTVFYSIQDDSGLFKMDPSGELYTAKTLDAETQTDIRLSVVAQDNGVPALVSRCLITVKVLDVNDNAPFFVLPHQSKVLMREELPPGSEVVQVRANDPDSGDNGTVVYKILEGERDLFSIEPRTGLITLEHMLDFERVSTPLFPLKIQAEDKGSPPQRSVKEIVIELVDVDDGQKSSFRKPNGMDDDLGGFEISESAVPGTKIGALDSARAQRMDSLNIGAIDDRELADSNLLDISFEIVKGNSQGLFEIDRVSSILYLVKPLDYETSSIHTLEISRVDLSRPALPVSSVKVIRINVMDENDNAPVFPEDPVMFSVPEDARLGQVVWVFNASDSDSGANGRIQYTIIEQSPESGVFDVDPVTGELWLQTSLDYERSTEYLLVVEASDHAINPNKRRSARVTTWVYVTDINDNRPEFRSVDRIDVFEDEPAGYPLMHVVAVDQDWAENGRVTYSISAGNELHLFSLNETSGSLTLSKRLDRESPRIVQLHVVASDHGNPPQATPQILKITIQNVNLDTPRFKQSLYKTNISENLNPGSEIVRVEADQSGLELSDNSGHLVYELASSQHLDKFSMDRHTGVLKTVVILDREEQELYMLTVYVRDADRPARYDAATVIVHVDDVNDHAPELAEASCLPITVPENQQFDNLHSVFALDLDSGLNGQVSYSISAGNQGGKFHMNPNTGQISCEPLDREAVGEYELTILARDNGIPSKAVSCQLIVRVLDVNDQAPKFDLPVYIADIEENQPSGTTVIRLSATDLDEGSNGQVTYSLVNNTDGLFEIDPNKGIITTVTVLDFEKLTAYSLKVRASDRGISEPLFTEAQITVRVVDVNDHAPLFTQVPYISNVTTDISAGQRVARVTATDADGQGTNSEVFYSLSNPSDDFTINPTTGVISARRSLRLQPGVVYYLSVQAADQGKPPQTSDGIVEIRVMQSVPGAADKEEDSIVFPKEAYRSSVSEGTAQGTEILTLKAFRRLTGQTEGIQYQIVSGNVGDAFAVETLTGRLYVGNSESLDYESHPVFRLVVEASSVLVRSQSPSGQSPDQAYVSVLVDIKDINDHQPQFLQQRYSTAVWEGKPRGTFVIQVSAVDHDTGENAHITYSIVSGNLDSAFSVDETGVVKTNAQLDREIQDKYSLTVMATDSGRPPGSGTTIVEIQVIDVNDNSPSFPPIRTIKVKEDVPVGSLVSIVTANDVDANPILEYSFVPGGNPQGFFAINRFSGRLTVAKELDYESMNDVHLEIEVSDRVHSVRTKLKAMIEDVNDNAPKFDQPFYQVSLPEDTPIGASIVQTRATDADSGENSKLHYKLIDDPTQGFYSSGFWIDSKNGAIHTNQTLAKAGVSGQLIQLIVEASDGGNPKQTAITTVQIQIVSRTQQKQPRFLEDFYRFSVPEDAAAHSIVGVIGVVLPPGLAQGSNGLKFRILSGDDSRAFSIDDQGRLVLDRLLDRETREQYSLQVSVHTKANSVANSTCTVVVEVEDVNDNSPKFAESQMRASIGEASAIGSTVTRLSASDIDTGPHGQIIYEITSGDEGKLFKLDKLTGVLTTGAKLSTLLNPIRLVIRASDQGSPPRSTITTLVIGIEDENDNGPFFPLQLYLSRIAENAAKGSLVFSAKASDRDNGDFGKIVYSLEDRSDAPQRAGDSKAFSINEVTGEVRTDGFFDYETRTSYHFTIVATDPGGRQSTVPGQVLIKGVDEFAPSFLQKEYAFRVSYDAQVGDVVGVVYAIDDDFGADGEIKYYLKEPNEYFMINNITGVISVKKSPKILGQSLSIRMKRAVNDQHDDQNLQADGSSDVGESAPLVKTMFITIIARSGADNAPNPKENTTLVELQLGNFAVGPSTGSLFDPKTITIISIVLVLIVIALLLFLALKLRRQNDKRPPSREKRLALPLNAKKASKLSSTNGNGSLSAGTGSTGVPLMRRLSSTSACSAQGGILAFGATNGSHNRVRSSPVAGDSSIYQASPVWLAKSGQNYSSNGIYGHHKRVANNGPRPVPSPMPPALTVHGHANPQPARKPLNSVSNLSAKSSGRGSVIYDEQSDEEIRQLTSRAASSRSQQGGRSMPDSGINMLADDTMSVASDLPSAQEYLTSLGVTDVPPNRTYQHDINKVVATGRVEAVELLDASTGLDADGVDVQELIYSKVSEVLAEDGEVAGTARPLGDVRMHQMTPMSPIRAPSGPLFPLSPTPLQTGLPPNWGPAYQPLTQVFSEITKLKHDQQDSLSRHSGHSKRNKTGSQSSFPASMGPGRPLTPTRLPLHSVNTPHQYAHFPSPSLPMWTSGETSPGVWVPRFASPSSPPENGLYATGQLPVSLPRTLPSGAAEMSESEVEIKI